MKSKFLTALLSLAIAVGIWLYVVTVVSPNSDKQFYNVPVVTQSEALLHDRGLMITDTDISAVSVHLEGSRIDLNKLSSANITVTVDVSKIYEAGTHNLTYAVSYPPDIAQNAISVLSKNPGAVTVEVEERISKEVPVDVRYHGSLAENFMADKENIELEYNSVSVTGPKSVIDQIEMAKIDLDLEGRNESITGQFAYTLCNAQAEPVDAEQVVTDVANVNLTLRIIRVKEIKLTVNVVDGGGATAQTSNITISPETIWISGGDALLEDMESLELGTVNLGEISEDKALVFPIKLPEGISDETGVAEAVVEVKFPELATKTLTVSNINAINVPEGLKAEILTKALEIQLRGPKDKIEHLLAEDVVITVDFTGSQPGAVKIKAEITCSAREVGAVGSYTVSATVREDEK